MKVAVDIRVIGRKRTGDEAVFFGLFSELVRIDTKNEYHFLIDERPQKELEEVKKRLEIDRYSHVKMVSLGSGNKFRWNFFKVGQYCKRHRIDIYHTQYILPFYMPRHTKMVTHVHDVSFRAFPQYVGSMDLFFLNLLIPISLKRARKIIAVSEFTKHEIMKYYKVKSNHVAVVPNALGVRLSACDQKTESNPPSDEVKKYVREKYSLPEQYILYVGTMQPRKNVPALICAFSSVAAKIPDIHLVIAGKRRGHNHDPLVEESLEQSTAKDRVIFPGYIDHEDLSTVYQMAQLFVFPTFYEGFGMPILEAMSFGVPVIASDIDPHREVAGDDAVIFYSPKDVDSLRDVIYNSLIDPIRLGHLREVSVERARLFSWERSAKKLLHVYESL